MRSERYRPCHHQTARTLALMMLTSMLSAMPGCAQPIVEQPVTREYGGNTSEAQMDFWHTLAQRPLVSNDNALHALLLFTDGEDPFDHYDQRVEELKHRRWLYDGFDEPADVAVWRGTIASALARILKIKGGLTMRLIGPVPRYAVRELMYENILPPSSPRQTFSGTEFLGVIARAEDYQRRQAYLAAQRSQRSPPVESQDQHESDDATTENPTDQG